MSKQRGERKIIIRQEESKDRRQTEEVTRRAFDIPERIARGGIGCPYEHWMVHRLREKDDVPELSLVAAMGWGSGASAM